MLSAVLHGFRPLFCADAVRRFARFATDTVRLLPSFNVALASDLIRLILCRLGCYLLFVLDKLFLALEYHLARIIDAHGHSNHVVNK